MRERQFFELLGEGGGRRICRRLMLISIVVTGSHYYCFIYCYKRMTKGVNKWHVTSQRTYINPILTLPEAHKRILAAAVGLPFQILCLEAVIRVPLPFSKIPSSSSTSTPGLCRTSPRQPTGSRQRP